MRAARGHNRSSILFPSGWWGEGVKEEGGGRGGPKRTKDKILTLAKVVTQN